MKRLLLANIACVVFAAGSATAADLPVKALPPVPAAPAPTWTGFYVGASVGAEWLHDEATLSLPPGPPQLFLPFIAAGALPTAYAVDAAGPIASFQAGFNWQVSPRWIVGFEADISGPRVGGTQTQAPTPPVFGHLTLQYQTDVDYVGTLRGRLGALVTPSLLAYATGGFAYGRVTRSYTEIFASTDVQSTGSTSNVDTGWTAGGGLEYAMADHFTVRGEYLFIKLHGDSFTTVSNDAGCGVAGACSFTLSSNDPTIQIVRLGLNYRF